MEEYNDDNSDYNYSDDDDDDDDDDDYYVPNHEPIVHIMTSEQRAIFVDLDEMMKIEMDPTKIDDYLRSLVKALIMVTPSSYPIDRIFHIIMKEYQPNMLVAIQQK